MTVNIPKVLYENKITVVLDEIKYSYGKINLNISICGTPNIFEYSPIFIHSVVFLSLSHLKDWTKHV